MGPCVVCPITLMGPEHVLPVAWGPASESDVYWPVVSTNVYIAFLSLTCGIVHTQPIDYAIYILGSG